MTEKVVDGWAVSDYAAAEISNLGTFRPCRCPDTESASLHTYGQASMLGLLGAVIETVGAAVVAGADGKPTDPPVHQLAMRVRLRNGQVFTLTTPSVSVAVVVHGS